MKTVLFILALALSAGLNLYLYQRFTAADQARKIAERHFADCEQVTFQLQNQLSQRAEGAAAAPAR